MKVSIITATYNSEKTLSSCMDSVLSQNYSDIEYIIIDGASNDGTLALIESYAIKNPNIVYYSDKDRGIYDALNKGIELSTGDIIGFVHSDDYLADNTVIDQIVKAFLKFDVIGVYGDLHYVASSNVQKVIRYWRSQPFKEKLLLRGWMPAHPTLFLKKEVYKNKGSFDLNYKIAADYDFILRVFQDKNYTFKYLPITVTKMRIGGASNKGIKNLIRKTREDYRASRNNGLRLPLKVVLFKNFSKIQQWFKR